MHMTDFEKCKHLVTETSKLLKSDGLSDDVKQDIINGLVKKFNLSDKQKQILESL